MPTELIDEITNFQKLEEYTKNSNLKFREAIIAYYKKMGEEKGFSVRENTPIIKNTVNYGKIELIWLEPNITFTTEFGNLEEIYKHLWKILEYEPNIAVLILSSKAGCKAEEAAKIISKSTLVGEKRKNFVLMDITEKKVLTSP